MKFEMRKDKLLDIVNKMFIVATRGVKSEYTLGGCLTIEVKRNEVSFITSNGHILAQCNVACENNKVGTATIDVARMKKITHAVGGSCAMDHILTVKVTNQSLTVSDQSNSGTIRKSEATVPVMKEHHKPESIDSTKYKCEYTFNTDLFNTAVRSLEKYKSPTLSKIRYQMVCLHFLKKEQTVRFICGDGMRFGIYIAENENYRKLGKGDLDDKMYLLPAEQAVILTEISESTPDDVGGQTIKICYKNDSVCHLMFDNGMQAILKYIPKVDYVDYAKHAFKTDEASSITDIERKVLVDGMGLINACEDPDITNDTFHSAEFKSSGELLSLSVHEGKFQCDYEATVNITALKHPEFESEYCARFLTDVSAAGEGEFIRFYCIDKGSIMIAEPMDLQEGTDKKTSAPLPKERDRRLILFFASTIHT